MNLSAFFKKSCTNKCSLSVLLLIMASGHVASAQVVGISGKNPGYAGMHIPVFQYTDYITKNIQEMDAIEVDSSGHYTTSIAADEVTQVFFDLGYYKGYLFIEPGHQYQIIFPPRIELSQEQKLNPYFQPEEIHIGVIRDARGRNQPTGPGLNRVINNFEHTYNHVFNQAIQERILHPQSFDTDSVMAGIDSISKGVALPFFTRYKRYRKGLLAYNLSSIDHKTEQVMENYFTRQPVLYNNPAYMELFNLTFKDYFHFHALKNTRSGLLERIIRNKSYHQLIQVMKSDPFLHSDSLIEMVILKEIHDNFYKQRYPREVLIELIDSLYFYSGLPEHKYIAQNIREKVTRLLPGFKAPGFSLTRAKGDTVSLSDYRGKFVYLNFCSSASFTCMQDFELLKSMHDNIRQYLQIVTVTVDANFEDMLDYKQTKQLNWDFLNYRAQPDILKSYNVKAFPTYYLIDPTGNLLLSPAPSPQENLNSRLYQILRNRGVL